MNFKLSALLPGLYLVATPIGRARDITLHALDTLASADVLAAEDTRTLRKLLDIHGIPINGRKLVPYHDHSSAADRVRLVDMIKSGQSVALTSDAGTPLIADPGYHLVTDVRAAGLLVTMAPGPSAATMALAVSGLPSDRFLFVGFLPSAAAGRRAKLAALASQETTLVFYESPKRLKNCLWDMADKFGDERHAVVCRELTKRFEEVCGGALSDLAEKYQASPPKGECVIVVGPGLKMGAAEQDIDAALMEALKTHRVKDAATVVAGALGLPKRQAYQRALELSKAVNK